VIFMMMQAARANPLAPCLGFLHFGVLAHYVEKVVIRVDREYRSIELDGELVSDSHTTLQNAYLGEFGHTITCPGGAAVWHVLRSQCPYYCGGLSSV
jgi:hypothetical protein